MPIIFYNQASSCASEHGLYPPDDGTNIQTYSANGADAQKFKLVKTSNANVFGILTKVSNDKKGLDVYNFGTSDGSNVCQWTYYQNSCQLWQFEKCNN